MPSVELAVIAAAGLGSRLGAEVPKCLVPIDGVSIIERQLKLLQNVPEIRVVVGYREVEVIDLVSAIRPDAIFVRNPAFASTNTIHSLRLATRHRAGWFLAIDGDLIIEPGSFSRFLKTCVHNDVVLGVGQSGTDEGVFVQTCGDLDQEMLVTGFSREVRTALEWSGLAHLHSDHVAIGDRFVFEALTPHLPMVGEVIDAAEVDTPRDLRRAREIVRAWDKAASGAQPAVTSRGASEARG
jgi:choline kinase